MATYTVDSTHAGTALVSAAGTITAMTVAAAPTITDPNTPVLLTDGPGGKTLFCAAVSALAFLFEPRPGVPLTPGITAPTFPRSLMTGTQAFVNGIFCQSCPAGISLTITA